MRQTRAATPLDELTAAAFRRDATAADVEALRAALEAQRQGRVAAGRRQTESDDGAEFAPSRRRRIGGPFWLGVLGGAGAAALVAIALVALTPRPSPGDGGDPSGAPSASADSDTAVTQDAGSPSTSTLGGHADDPAVVRIDGVGASVDVDIDPSTGRIVAGVDNDWSLIGSSQPDPQRGADAPAWRLWMTTTASGEDCYMAVELAAGQATTAATRCGRPLVGVDVAELRLPSYRIAVRSDGISIEEI